MQGHDQAAALRRMVHGASSPIGPVRSSAIFRKALLIASGKGGVGKTHISTSLAAVLAERENRVLLIDADFSLANCHVTLGLRTEWDLSHVFLGLKGIEETILRTPWGFDLLPASSGANCVTDVTRDRVERMFDLLQPLAGRYDQILIDAPAGVSEGVMALARSVGRLWVVTTPDPTACTDAYALLKRTSASEVSARVSVLVNQTESSSEGTFLGRRLAEVAQHFLGITVTVLGGVPADPILTRAVRDRRPVVIHDSLAPSAKAIARLTDFVTGSKSMGNNPTWKRFENHG